MSHRSDAAVGRVDVEGALVERIAFERLLADLSARFAAASSVDVMAQIDDALGRLVLFFGYDRCTYSEFAADGTLNVLCSAAISGIEPMPRGAFGTGLPWLITALRAGRIVAMPTLPEGLPPEAAAEAEFCRRSGLRSHLSIPLSIGDRVTGVLSFAGLRHARNWPEDMITRLRIIGGMFVGAIARVRSEDETRKLRQRLWHADRLARTGELTAAIAHELNQPLAAILSNAQAGLRYLDRDAATPAEVRAILDAIVRDDKRAAQTIWTLRGLLRRDESRRERIDLAAALREVLQLLAGELSGQGIRVQTQLDTPCPVVADRAQIEQVALNLILNAAAAMRARAPGERVLRLSAFRDDEGRVVAALRDSGTGIAAEHLETVFEPFWTTRREGLGLGLPICRSIVEAHGGTIRAEPNADRGVTFRFDLPGDVGRGDGDADADAQPAEPHASEEPTMAVRSGPVVCVVDDDAAVRASLVRLLAATGWQAAAYASAEELLAHRPLADIACMLLDIRMPGMSGLDLQRQLARDGVAPPVVFLTGHHDVSVGVDAMKLGAVDFLVKPVEADVLVAVVRKALEHHTDERQRTLERETCAAKVRRLSVREREVLEHVIRGRLNKQIAADLDIAEQTVKQHRGRVMEKMGVRSVAELVRVCEASMLFDVATAAAARLIASRAQADPGSRTMGGMLDARGPDQAHGAHRPEP